MLSKKVVREDDIDDGTYTTLERKQVEDVFRRVKCDEDEIDDQLDEMRAYLKKRIRDLKRIFTFYAASNDSGATDSEMDRYEFWKLVKDCKLQRNRKNLPSVRVDLIFQKCQMNMALEGKERTASMTEELPSKKFVIVLLRLASYRYVSGTLPERLERMMEMEVLPNACRTETDRFRETLHTDKVEAMLDRFRKPLKMIFGHYARRYFSELFPPIIEHDAFHSYEPDSHSCAHPFAFSMTGGRRPERPRGAGDRHHERD